MLPSPPPSGRVMRVRTILAGYSQGQGPSGLRREGPLWMAGARGRTSGLRRAVLAHSYPSVAGSLHQTPTVSVLCQEPSKLEVHCFTTEPSGPHFPMAAWIYLNINVSPTTHTPHQSLIRNNLTDYAFPSVSTLPIISYSLTIVR